MTKVKSITTRKGLISWLGNLLAADEPRIEVPSGLLCSYKMVISELGNSGAFDPGAMWGAYLNAVFSDIARAPGKKTTSESVPSFIAMVYASAIQGQARVTAEAAIPMFVELLDFPPNALRFRTVERAVTLASSKEFEREHKVRVRVKAGGGNLDSGMSGAQRGLFAVPA